MRTGLPFPLRGTDSDETAFLNALLYRYCQEVEIAWSRPYKKSDQAQGDKSSWSVVRELVGHRRYESA